MQLMMSLPAPRNCLTSQIDHCGPQLEAPPDDTVESSPTTHWSRNIYDSHHQQARRELIHNRGQGQGQLCRNPELDSMQESVPTFFVGMSRPAHVPSFRLMCVMFTSSGSVAGSTAKLWFCALISI